MKLSFPWGSYVYNVHISMIHALCRPGYIRFSVLSGFAKGISVPIHCCSPVTIGLSQSKWKPSLRDSRAYLRSRLVSKTLISSYSDFISMVVFVPYVLHLTISLTATIARCSIVIKIDIHKMIVCNGRLITF